MKYEKLHLKDYFPSLGKDECDPIAEIYLPYNIINISIEKRPCMVICPGGGYSRCSQRESEPVALHFLSEGYNVFVIKYSVAPHRFPTQLREVAALIEIIHKNAKKWNCDTEKIVIMGFSAGGHLAAQYSNMYNCDAVREIFPESKRVKANVLCYPVITADPTYAHMGSFKNLTGKTNLTEEEINLFSCDRNVNKDTPPTFIWQTAADNSVPVMNSLIYAKALSIYKIPFELHIYPYGKHGLATCDKQTNDDVTDEIHHASAWLDSLKNWLRLINITNM